MNALPEFILVGAAKSGTTSLFKTLSAIPSVYIPEMKECRFFSQMPRNFKGGNSAKFQNEGPRELNEYIKLFKSKEHLIKGDMSNDYFYYYEKSITNIKKTYLTMKQPEPSILIVLRNPIDRIFSMYAHILRLNGGVESFEKSFELSKKRVNSNYAWTYDLSGVGMSADAVMAYKVNFKNVAIILYEHLFTPQGMAEISSFLRLPKGTELHYEVKENVNEYKMPNHVYIDYLVRGTSRIFSKAFKESSQVDLYKKLRLIRDRIMDLNKAGGNIALSNENKNHLARYYAEDVKKLELILEKDLSYWLR